MNEKKASKLNARQLRKIADTLVAAGMTDDMMLELTLQKVLEQLLLPVLGLPHINGCYCAHRDGDGQEGLSTWQKEYKVALLAVLDTLRIEDEELRAIDYKPGLTRVSIKQWRSMHCIKDEVVAMFISQVLLTRFRAVKSHPNHAPGPLDPE